MNNQFKKSIVSHITELHNYYKSEADKWEVEMKKNPKLKQPREEYIRYHWEYRAYASLIHNIKAGNYDSVEYYDNYLDPNSEHRIEMKKKYNLD